MELFSSQLQLRTQENTHYIAKEGMTLPWRTFKRGIRKWFTLLTMLTKLRTHRYRILHNRREFLERFLDVCSPLLYPKEEADPVLAPWEAPVGRCDISHLGRPSGLCLTQAWEIQKVGGWHTETAFTVGIWQINNAKCSPWSRCWFSVTAGFGLSYLSRLSIG